MSPDHHARLATLLTDRDRWLIRMLHEHHVLTSTAIIRMAFPPSSARFARRRLLQLYDWNVLDRFRPLTRRGTAPMHYVIGAAGAAVLAAEEAVTVRELGYRRDAVLAIAHRATLAHTVAVNDLFSHLVAHSRNTGADERFRLTEWWSEARCTRYVGDLARPDAYGRITPHHSHPTAGRGFEWFLEFDFGTEALHRLAAKIDGYAQLAAATSIPVPVLFWLPGARREAGARVQLARALRGLDNPDLVPLATTAPLTLDDHDNRQDRTRFDPAGLYGSGLDPAGRVWLPLGIDGRPTRPDRPATAGRYHLAALAALWPPPAPERSHHRLVLTPSGRRSSPVDLAPPDPIPPLPRPRRRPAHPAQS